MPWSTVFLTDSSRDDGSKSSVIVEISFSYGFTQNCLPIFTLVPGADIDSKQSKSTENSNLSPLYFSPLF